MYHSWAKREQSCGLCNLLIQKLNEQVLQAEQTIQLKTLDCQEGTTMAEAQAEPHQDQEATGTDRDIQKWIQDEVYKMPPVQKRD